MKVSELIEKLQTMPQDAEVLSSGSDGLHDFFCEVTEPHVQAVAQMIDNPHFDGLYVEAAFICSDAKIKTKPIIDAVIL
jgi:hypothetical protein